MDFGITTSGIQRRDTIKKILTEKGYTVKQIHVISSDWTTVIEVKDLDEAKKICSLLCIDPEALTIRISEI